MNTSRTGRFAARLPAGRYRVIAGLDHRHGYVWPMGSCWGLRGDGVSFDHHAPRGYLIIRSATRVHIDVGCVAG